MICRGFSNKEGQMGSSDNKTQSSPYHVKCLKDHEPSVSLLIVLVHLYSNRKTVRILSILQMQIYMFWNCNVEDGFNW